MMPAPSTMSSTQAAELARILAEAAPLLTLVDQELATMRRGLAAMQAIVDGTADAPATRGQRLRRAA
ncbi:hypothetical protein ACFXJ8_39370 [Nonomuraea sp. NPDC059194]|uniref:hypothetical protein n=1 Tax=Nonomuraea sp. NPDC059194 TaxID=3346764 RepID=UPI0036C0544B